LAKFPFFVSKKPLNLQTKIAVFSSSSLTTR
jgi:hypothetical protein